MSSGNFAKDRLRGFVERIERLEEEKAAIAADIKEVYGEAKGDGFNNKIIKAVVKLRKMDSADREEQFALIDLYMQNLGMGARDQTRAALAGESEPVEAAVDPDYLVAALNLVAAKGQGKLTCEDGGLDDEGRGVIEVVKAKGAKGAAGAAFDLVHTALLEAGFHHLGKHRFQAPPEEAGDTPREHSLEDARAIAAEVGKGQVVVKQSAGGLTVARKSGAEGDVGALVQAVMDALAAAGYRHAGGNMFALPASEEEGGDE